MIFSSHAFLQQIDICKCLVIIRQIFDVPGEFHKFVDKQKVKFEGVKEAMVYTNYSIYAIQFDLKSGYHHLEIHPEHQKSV
jgi:hypothetical protein